MNCLLGGSDWSYDLRLPSHDQVHVPQVRHFRQHREARCPLHLAAQHRQRKNLYLHLVLAPNTGVSHVCHFGNFSNLKVEIQIQIAKRNPSRPIIIKIRYWIEYKDRKNSNGFSRRFWQNEVRESLNKFGNKDKSTAFKSSWSWFFDFVMSYLKIRDILWSRIFISYSFNLITSIFNWMVSGLV